MRVVELTDQDRAALAAAPRVPPPRGVCDYAGVVVKKPWGDERELYRDERQSIWELSIDRGAETSMHCHPNKTTILAVMEGQVVIHTLEHHLICGPGSVVLFEAGVFHRTEAVVESRLVEIESPPDKLDLVRIQDKYGREGQSYEHPGR